MNLFITVLLYLWENGVKFSLFIFSGLSSILECRGISQPTFFLCLNCAEKFSREKFCNHMTSERHQYAAIVSARLLNTAHIRLTASRFMWRKKFLS